MKGELSTETCCDTPLLSILKNCRNASRPPPRLPRQSASPKSGRSHCAIKLSRRVGKVWVGLNRATVICLFTRAATQNSERPWRWHLAAIGATLLRLRAMSNQRQVDVTKRLRQKSQSVEGPSAKRLSFLVKNLVHYDNFGLGRVVCGNFYGVCVCPASWVGKCGNGVAVEAGNAERHNGRERP